MLLNFLKRKRRVTSDDFAQMLWEFSCMGSIGLYDRIKPRLAEGGYELSTDENSKLFREIVIANLWTVRKSLSADRNVLCSLHHIVASEGQDPPDEEAKGIRFPRRELRGRYEKYDAVCEENSGGPLMLSVMMLESMLPGRQASFDAMLGFLIMSHVGNTIKAILKLRTSFTITD